MSVLHHIHHSPELYQRISDLRPHVTRLHDVKLHLMYQNCVSLWAELDREFVECRRKRKVTQKYTGLATKLDEALVVLEQHVTFGTLLKM